MNTINVKALGEQVRRFRARFVQGASGALSQLLPQAELETCVRHYAGSYRNRIYAPLVTLGLFVDQVMSADHSCQDAVARGVSAQVAAGQVPGSLSTGPYCKARQRLVPELLVRLSQALGRRLCEAQPTLWRWRGREVKLIDGTTVSMPDTRTNQTQYPQGSQQKAGLGFPIARIVGIISLGCGAIVEWAMGPCEGKKSGENSMLWTMGAALNPGDIVLADRYYAGYFTLARLLGLGVDVVTRQHQLRHTDFRRGQRLGKHDHVVTWIRPQRPAWMDETTYNAMSETLTLRETRVGGWILVSSLSDARTVSKQDLLQLYGWRWQIELDFRAIKTVMQMDVLRCKTPAMILKEIAAHLFAYNLVRSVMAQAACIAGVLPRQLSFKAALQQLRAFEQQMRHGQHTSTERAHDCILWAIGRMKLPHRPGRVEPRAVKRRPKNQPILTQPRSALRARLKKQQEQHIASFNSA
jgi:hypothetical protein